MANKAFNKSVFAQYFQADDAISAAWTANVLNKVIAPGIVPNYIIREDDQGTTDFATVYKPLILFFAYFVRLGREFGNFRDNDFLADQFLIQRGHYTSGHETVEQLQWSLENFLRRFSHRGTVKSIEKNISAIQPSGEILQLFAWDYFKFFKMGVPRPQWNGWNMDHSGPAGRGLTGRYDLNVAYENSEDVYDKNKYPLVSDNLVFLGQYRGKNSLHVTNVPFGQFAGIGGTDLSKEIVIDNRINFEITFYVAQDITLENVTFGCKVFDANGNELNFQNIVTGGDSNFFFETRRLNQAGRFYMVRGILYRHDHPNLSADQGRLNIGFGQNLRFPENAVSIIPQIYLDNNFGDDEDGESDWFESDSLDQDPGDFGSDESGAWSDDGYDGEPSVYIWNVKVNPCSTSYNRCYLDNKNFIDVFGINSNGRFNDIQIKDVLRKYFIPYNSAFNLNVQLGIPVEQQESYLLLEEGDDNKILLEDDGKIPLE